MYSSHMQEGSSECKSNLLGHLHSEIKQEINFQMADGYTYQLKWTLQMDRI